MTDQVGVSPSGEEKAYLVEVLVGALVARLRDARDLMPEGKRRDEETAWLARYLPADEGSDYWRSGRRWLDDGAIESFERYGLPEDGDGA